VSKKILVVDDEEDILKVLDKRLTSAGYSVIKAKNGKVGVELAKSERPALILLDINMPGMSGAEVETILGNDSETKDIPIVFVTAMSMGEEEKKLGHAVGKDFFIAKPYDPDELLRKVQKHIK